MTTQRKPLHTHVITVLFVLFQFIQFFPSSLVSSLTASAETNNSVTLFSDDKGSGDATWSLSEDGKLITWDITVTQNESETEAAPTVEVVVPQDVGAPQIVSATPAGVFNTSGNTHTFTAPYSTTAQTLTLTFTTAVSNLTSQNLEFNIGASIQAKDSPAAPTLRSVSIPNKLAQLEAQRIAEEKAEAERIAAEKAEEERIAAEEKATQEEADRLAEEQRLADEKAAQEEADRLAEEQRLAEEKAAQEDADKIAEEEQLASETEATEEAVPEEISKENTVAEENEDIKLDVKAEEDSEEVEQSDSVKMMTADDFNITNTTPPARGDYSIDFKAYNPLEYDIFTPSSFSAPPSGRASEPIPGANSNFLLSALNPKDLALGQIVPFQLAIDVSRTGQDGVVEFDIAFGITTTNGDPFGYDSDYKIYAAFVDVGDPHHLDSGQNATVEIIGNNVVGNEIIGDFRVSGLDGGDEVKVEIWVVLQEELIGNPGGNVQARLGDASTFGESIPGTGTQTNPLQRVGEFKTATADVGIIKSDHPDPVYVNEELTYTITVENSSPDTVANGIVIEDTLDSNVTFISVSDSGIHSGADTDGSGGIVTWPAFALGPGDTRDFTLTVQVNPDAPTNNFLGTEPDVRGIASAEPILDTDITNIVRILSMITSDDDTTNWVWQEPTNVLAELIDITARKLWKGGLSEDHVAVELILSRKIEGGEYQIVDIDPMITPDSGTSDSFDYLWSNLPQFDAEGNEYTYRITEELSIPNYDSNAVFDEELGIWIVTNTFNSPEIPIEAVKRWVNGPEVKPDVEFQLYRYLEVETVGDKLPVGDPVAIANPGGTGSYDVLVDMGMHPVYNDDGIAYVYVVEEITVLEDYVTTYDDLTFSEGDQERILPFIINTYEIPTDDIEATKTWINGESVRPDLWFQLRRYIDDKNLSEAVDVKKLPDSSLPNDTVSVTFEDIEQTDSDGNAYTFYVDEGTYDETEGFAPGTPENFEQSGDGLALTNTYKIPTTTANATKYWIGSEKDKHEQVELTLWRTLDSETAPEEVLDFDLLTITPEDGISDEFYYEWSGLDKTDASGNEYIYYFTEDEVPGFNRIYSEPIMIGDVEYQPSGGSVTNKQMTIDFSFTKVDEEGYPLEGSDFTLEREDDGTLITNDGVNPEFIFAGLTEGRYILTETKAPPGYNLPTNPWIIEVVRNEESGELEIIIPDDSFLSVTADGYALENNEQGEFPQTGGIGVVSYLSFGMLAIFSSIGFYLKKEENGGY
ncbi:Cna B-type domain-containing protein [Alkalibacterium putridalgicola]|uniref:Cna B-type domain-containing protein n=1 Tax=Alkalibacterium putridalgicola TaxID=426703 RepID=UPI0034CF1963